MQVKHAFRVGVYSQGTQGYADVELISDSISPLSYDLTVPDQGTVWTFGRSLFSEAFQHEGQEIGLGDVRTQIDNETFCLTLESPEGLATLEFPVLSVLDFIMESDTYIPAQRIDEIVNAELDQFLANLSSEE